MIFLFEQFPYDLDFLKIVLPKQGRGYLPYVQKGPGSTQCIDAIGYIYNKDIESKDPTDKIVFILPKVFVEEGRKAFGVEISPKGGDVLKAALAKHSDFLSELSLWVCSSISVYHQNNPSTNDVCTPSPRAEDFSRGVTTPTLIDVMNSMKRFYEENKSLFVFVSKNTHSGNNRIDWRRTMRKTPFMQGDSPIYMELVNKKKVFDLDDRLLVLYFSAMNYIAEKFRFKMPKSEFYEPMKVTEFRHLLGHKGLMELRRIKHKYFADKFLKLYNIMEAFFRWGGVFQSNGCDEEYLLTNKYNNVFEHMIDVLVGDNSEKIQKMKNLKDGKIIDHLYKEQGLIFADKADDNSLIWHIGDSKYYSDAEDIRGQSLAKQFTYAKNVIQDFFSPKYFGKGKNVQSPHEGIRYRDELTEGYSVTPNFFIRGELPPFAATSDAQEKQFKSPYFSADGDEKEKLFSEVKEKDTLDDGEGDKSKNIRDHLWEKRNRHFENRLFDRDTLLLQVYNVNFLYTLKSFLSKRSALRDEYRTFARETFRKNFLKLLDEKYAFWGVWPKKEWTGEECFVSQASVVFKDAAGSSELKTFVYKHGRTLAGKMFRPNGFDDCLIVALEKSSEECKDGSAFWEAVEGDCQMIAPISPAEIWNGGYYVDQQQKPMLLDDAILREHNGKKYAFLREENN